MSSSSSPSAHDSSSSDGGDRQGSQATVSCEKRVKREFPGENLIEAVHSHKRYFDTDKASERAFWKEIRRATIQSPRRKGRPKACFSTSAPGTKLSTRSLTEPRRSQRLIRQLKNKQAGGRQ
jgi:hypothetical protein